MRSDICGACDIILLCAPQETNIVSLENQDNHPVYARQHRVDAEAARVMIVLAPYRVAMMVPRAFAWLLERVDGSENDKHEPGDDGKDLVG
jgi:hypothetical protein